MLTVFTKSQQRESGEVDRTKHADEVCDTEHDRTIHIVFTL